jgi:exonuclease III
MVNDIISLENSNILNQYDSSTTNFYSDFKFNPPSYNTLNSDLKDSSNNLKVYHQNIRCLRGKLSQLPNILYSELPQLICINVHHLKDFEMDVMTIDYYQLSIKFCRHQYKNGGICIYVHESIDFDSISTHHVYKEKDLEMHNVKLNLPKIKMIITTIYRSPTGSYNYFMRKLDSLLNLLYTKKLEFIFCGNININ